MPSSYLPQLFISCANWKDMLVGHCNRYPLIGYFIYFVELDFCLVDCSFVQPTSALTQANL